MARSRRPQGLAGPEHREQSRRPGLFQVQCIPRHQYQFRAVLGGARVRPPGPEQAAAGGALVLPAAIHRLRHRRPSRHGPAGEESLDACGLRVVLPASAGGPDRAGGQSPAATADERSRDPAGLHRRPLDLRRGLFQEGRPGGLPGAVCRQGLRHARPVPRPGIDPGDVSLCLADLLRFQRLHGHGPGRRPDDGHSPDAELRQPVSGDQHGRLLETLAHQPVVLVPGLRLHPARRQSQGQAGDLPERLSDDGAVGPLARSGVDLRALGRGARPGQLRHARAGANLLLPAPSAARSSSC